MPLKLAGSVRSPCFGVGMMTLLVHSRGAVPVLNARFMMLSSWAEAIPDLKNSAGISSLPGALFLSFWSADSSSSGESGSVGIGRRSDTGVGLNSAWDGSWLER